MKFRFSQKICEKPAVALAVSGCVHEHLVRGNLCQRHLRIVLARPGRCSECPAQERCELVTKYVEYAEDSS